MIKEKYTHKLGEMPKSTLKRKLYLVDSFRYYYD